jgi:ribosomal protein S18 acetylase RimI-like enzyme
MLGYYRELPTPNGQVLIVQPVSEEWVEPAADLLTEAFADSIGYMSIYKNFLRRQIRNYLRSHMNLPPKTVCLVALLVDKEVLEKQPQIDEDSGFYSDLEASEGESGGGGGGQNFDSARGSAADVAGGMMGDGMGNNIWPSFSSNHSSSSTSEEDATSSTLRSSGGGGGGSDGARSPRVNPTTATLVGAVEVSFTESTRSKEWTGLNPPPERPYLCNMAVADNVRRQGIGGLLLKAAEELVQQVGEDQMYLHLRFKDAPAQALYRKAGYIPAAQDSIFVMLVGQDRRWLMKKILTEEQL